MEATLFAPADWRDNERYKLLWHKDFKCEYGQRIALAIAQTSHLFQEVSDSLPPKVIWTVNMLPELNVDLRTPIGSDPGLTDGRLVLNHLKVALNQTELAMLIPNLLISLDVNYRYSVGMSA